MHFLHSPDYLNVKALPRELKEYVQQEFDKFDNEFFKPWVDNLSEDARVLGHKFKEPNIFTQYIKSDKGRYKSDKKDTFYANINTKNFVTIRTVADLFTTRDEQYLIDYIKPLTSNIPYSKPARWAIK